MGISHSYLCVRMNLNIVAYNGLKQWVSKINKHEKGLQEGFKLSHQLTAVNMALDCKKEIGSQMIKEERHWKKNKRELNHIRIPTRSLTKRQLNKINQRGFNSKRGPNSSPSQREIFLHQ
jgi:hypothetical protein